MKEEAGKGKAGGTGTVQGRAQVGPIFEDATERQPGADREESPARHAYRQPSNSASTKTSAGHKQENETEEWGDGGLAHACIAMTRPCHDSAERSPLGIAGASERSVGRRVRIKDGQGGRIGGFAGFFLSPV